MRKTRLVPVLLAAVVCGLLAAYLALTQLSAAPTTGGGPAQKGQLAVAARYLPQGTILRQEDVHFVEWSSPTLPPGYSSSVAELVGRGLLTDLQPNEPVLAAKLADKSAGGGLPILIPEGMRAVSVKVDEVIGVAGFVVPGTRVDVLVTLDRGNDQGSMTRVVLQDVRALAAGQTVQRDPEGKPQTVPVITLLVSPEDAERLTLAATEGRIQLALRNMLDAGRPNTQGARTAGLLGQSAPAAAAAPRNVVVQQQPRAAAPRERAGMVVETFKGGVRSLQTF
ncbi:MAG TPA: Flp pilus assembly protein CpaB [Longimicrobiaceae bacterium]|nr:Flp pilus assembly protein CpaB [Longimicrobiaceae bacterium]